MTNEENDSQETKEQRPLMSLDDYCNLPVSKADHRFHYGEDASQFGELYLPELTLSDHFTELFSPDDVKPWPVIVFLHGGCWSSQFNLEPVGGLCRALAENCRAAVWNVEYRRWGNGGGWPHTFVDAANAIDILVAMEEEFLLDLNNIVVVGHSAGGQLALWLAARPQWAGRDPAVLPIKGVVALAPVCDLESASARGVCRSDLSKLLLKRAAPSLVSMEQMSTRYDQGSPFCLLPLGVRHISIVGAQDTVADPLVRVAPFVEIALELGDDASFISIGSAGHFELVSPDTAAGQIVLEIIRNEVNR